MNRIIKRLFSHGSTLVETDAGDISQMKVRYMSFDLDMPFYLGLAPEDWAEVQSSNRLSGTIQLTSSMRIAEEDAADCAKRSTTRKGVVLKLNARALYREHGTPQVIQGPRHRREEYNFRFTKEYLEDFIRFVVAFYDISNVINEVETSY